MLEELKSNEQILPESCLDVGALSKRNKKKKLDSVISTISILYHFFLPTEDSHFLENLKGLKYADLMLR